MATGEGAYEPLPRWGHTSVTIGDRVYMWGGRTDDFSESMRKTLSTKLEVFYLSEEYWEQKKTKGSPPLGLYNNAFTAIGRDLYVYGGWDGHTAHNTLHKLNVDTLAWTEMESGDVDEQPMKMSGCGLVACGAERLVLFGGYGVPATSTTKPKGKSVNLVTTSSKSSKTTTPVPNMLVSPGHSQATDSEATASGTDTKAKDSRAAGGKESGGEGSGKEGGGKKEGGSEGEGKKESDEGAGKAAKESGAEGDGTISGSTEGNLVLENVPAVHGESSSEEAKDEGHTKDRASEGKGSTAEGKEGHITSGDEDTTELVLANKGAEDGSGAEGGASGVEGGISGEGEPESGTDDIIKLDLGRVEERKEEEDDDEDAEVMALIDKQWTNELKVYDIVNGCWSSPEVGGDCPPPCVDFSFDCIDGRLAVLFGGYRPESGASSGTYILNMETWNWTKLGDYETHKGKGEWPVGRDGHASCVLSEVPRPQILISGGWDKENRLLTDTWILDIQRKTWSKFPVPDSVGPRFWHRVVCYTYSPNLRQLVFFGGCPGAPMDTSGEAAWAKLASTVLVELGLVKKTHDVVRHTHSPGPHFHNSFKSQNGRGSRLGGRGSERVEEEWVVMDVINMAVMGEGTRRAKEKLLLAEHRANQAEAHALRAEMLAKEALGKLETILSRLEKGSYNTHQQYHFTPEPAHKSSFTPSAMHPGDHDSPRKISHELRRDRSLELHKDRSFDSPSGYDSIQREHGHMHERDHHTQRERIREAEKPFWVIGRDEVEITAEEIGRGKWSVVKVANYQDKKVAARCLYSHISEENRHVFAEGMDMAAKIRHPNLLSLIGAVVEEGEPVLITDLMATNLKKVMEKGKLYNYQIATIALDVANALKFLHTTRPHPVVHGDVAVTSVLLQKEVGNQWRAKLYDYMTAKFFRQLVSANSTDSDDMSQHSDVFASPSRSTTPRVTPPPLTHRSKILSGSDASLNNTRRLSTSRKLSVVAPDMLDSSTLTTERDVYTFGLLLVEMCTGTPPLGVSMQFLIESITWTEMTALVKLCVEFEPSKRPKMEFVVRKLKDIHHTTVSRPSKSSKLSKWSDVKKHVIQQ